MKNFAKVFYTFEVLGVLGFSLGCARDDRSRRPVQSAGNFGFSLAALPARTLPYETVIKPSVALEHLRRIVPVILSRQIKPSEIDLNGPRIDIQKWILMQQKNQALRSPFAFYMKISFA